MNFIWSLLLCLMFLLHEIHSMPFDFGDPMSIDFARILKETELARTGIDYKSSDDMTEEEQAVSQRRHHIKHIKKHRRSLKSSSPKNSNSKEYLSIPELNLSRRSKHLMLTKPYWAWP